LKKLIDGVPESLTFILSDFMYPFAAEYQFQRGAHGANKHEVKAIHVLETSEIKLPPYSRGMASLYDDEGRRQMVMDLSRSKAYADEMQHRMDDIKKRLNQAGIDSLIITPDDNFPFKITEFMGGHA
jgi:hypothetical protein